LQILLELFCFHGHNLIILMLPLQRTHSSADTLNLHTAAPEPVSPINTTFASFAPV